jgi:CHASE2 domain-containing sensor protein
MHWEYILQSLRTVVEGSPYIACGLSLWAFATMVFVNIIGLSFFEVQKKGNDFTIAFGITMMELVGIAGLVFLLAIYLIPVSLSLKLVLTGIDTSRVMNC